MIEKAITAVSGGRNLTYSEATDAMKEIVNGTATPAQIGAYVTALHMKGETIDELAASAEVMRSESKAFNGKGDILDIVGIGGDEINTFNISTAAMFVVAASGITVAKHVSRSSAKTTNSGDVLVKLGINLNVPAAVSEELLANDGLCFLYANEYHNRGFLFGYCEETGTVVTLALDRIQNYSVTDKPFHKNESIDFNTYFNDVIGVSIPNEDVKVETIVLRFTEHRFPYVLSKPIHQSQQVVDASSYTISIRVRPTKELDQVIFSFIPDVEVLSPKWYRQEIENKIKENLQKYLSVNLSCTGEW